MRLVRAAVTLALGGSLLGAVAGFLVGNAHGPAEVPAYTASECSIGLYAVGFLRVSPCLPRTLALAREFLRVDVVKNPRRPTA